MLEELFYKDILTLLFANERNKQYFREHYNTCKHYQIMLNDYLKMNIERTGIKQKLEKIFNENIEQIKKSMIAEPRTWVLKNGYIKYQTNNLTPIKTHSNMSKLKN